MNPIISFQHKEGLIFQIPYNTLLIKNEVQTQHQFTQRFGPSSSLPIDINYKL